MVNLLRSVIFMAVISLITACSQPEPTLQLAGKTMGTTYHITVIRNDQLPEANLLQTEIDMALEIVNNQMSTYRPNSELSRFNKLQIRQGTEVSPDTLTVVKEAIRLYKITDGALDITLGPLVNLWGFGPDKRPTTSPSLEAIQAAKAKTGISELTIDGNRLIKDSADLYVDLSSIAKGFGVDKIASLLDKYQVSGYLVEIGGEISVKGHKADGSEWRIAVEKPSEDGQEVQQVIELGTMALATSGDYRIYHEENGERFSHLIDPRSGYPIKHKLASATVLHKSSMTADGYATAMMVLGTEASLALAKEQNLAIMLIEKQEQGYQVYYSEAFKPYLD
ncbi:FAD:protein FMN transferase [Shewanella sp. SP1S2-7]|uniref:FAD:protein FMN transferase n=2 Tax=Shewanella holmiensis TaxID=2952222 RepID=A0A9X2WK65_9GAMM|nr:FAD:protein FMN transferase [Shewanella holmiensis]MCT7940897.1 FAD:protein FMN transferase [Shewanella holmiensis]